MNSCKKTEKKNKNLEYDSKAIVEKYLSLKKQQISDKVFKFLATK